MILVWTNEAEQVVRIHFQPNILTPEQQEGAFMIESIPEPDVVEGMLPVPHYNEVDGYYFKFEPVPEPEEIPVEEATGL